MVNLTVYKASAGSGKTFTLATEYIKLLIENPLAYRNILAVTFTNKATEEMKQRILWQLYGISKQLPSSESYIKNVCESLDISREKASEQATRALHELVHNYSYFRVGTIDAFFQNVLRNLARELDLTANLRVELNDKQIMEQAVDEMTAELASVMARTGVSSLENMDSSMPFGSPDMACSAAEYRISCGFEENCGIPRETIRFLNAITILRGC